MAPSFNDPSPLIQRLKETTPGFPRRDGPDEIRVSLLKAAEAMQSAIYAWRREREADGPVLTPTESTMLLAAAAFGREMGRTV